MKFCALTEVADRAVSVSSKHRTSGRAACYALDPIDDELEKRLVLQRLAGEVDREASDVLADRRTVLTQQLACALHHPAIHVGMSW